MENGVEILVVSSGAVAIGCSVIDRKRSQMSLNELTLLALVNGIIFAARELVLKKNDVKGSID